MPGNRNVPQDYRIFLWTRSGQRVCPEKDDPELGADRPVLGHLGVGGAVRARGIAGRRRGAVVRFELVGGARLSGGAAAYGAARLSRPNSTPRGQNMPSAVTLAQGRHAEDIPNEFEVAAPYGVVTFEAEWPHLTVSVDGNMYAIAGSSASKMLGRGIANAFPLAVSAEQPFFRETLILAVTAARNDTSAIFSFSTVVGTRLCRSFVGTAKWQGSGPRQDKLLEIVVLPCPEERTNCLLLEVRFTLHDPTARASRASRASRARQLDTARRVLRGPGAGTDGAARHGAVRAATRRATTSCCGTQSGKPRWSHVCTRRCRA